jgi:NADH-ubiquinone oxidoreductase chain 2
MTIISLVFFLLSCAINLKQHFAILFSRTFVFILLSLSILSYKILFLNSLKNGISIFGGLFTVTSINSSFNMFIYLLSIVIILLNTHYARKNLDNNNNFLSLSDNKISNSDDEKYKITEYSLIILFILTGGQFLMGSSDIISLFLSIELQSYGLYILCTVYRNSETSTSSGLTYFLLGGLASCFILLSTSLLYANSGCTLLENFYVISNIYDSVKELQLDNSSIFSLYSPYYIYISLVILSIGFLIKISAAPFHFWSPDVYDGVPTVVTTFISIIPKITILIFILDLVINININLYEENWNFIFIISSLLSLIIGTVLGLSQIRIKRLYAYSTISHVGFLLLALGNKTRESIQAFLFYITQYSISNLNAFFILITIGYSLYIYKYRKNSIKIVEHEANNSPIQYIDQLKGYFFVNPILALSLAITLFSFAGIPPLVGFFAKLMVLSSSIDNGYIFMSIIAILTSVIGGVYYLLIIKKMFFEENVYTLSNNLSLNNKDKSIVLSSTLTVPISILTSVILLFIFIPSESLNFLLILSMMLLNI